MTGKTDLYQLAIHEPDPPPKQLSMREERAMLRALLEYPAIGAGLNGPGPDPLARRFAPRHPTAFLPQKANCLST